MIRCLLCGGYPTLKRVGDNKQYLVYVCSGCGKSPAEYGEARIHEKNARRIWERQNL